VNASSETTGASGVVNHPGTTAKRPDSATGIQVFLLIDLGVRLLVWSGAIALATAAFTAMGGWPNGSLVDARLWLAWQWGLRLGWWILLFNLFYVAELVLLRLPIPTPREGRYSLVGRPDRQLLWSLLLGVLTKARYEAPFPGFLVYHIASLPPMRWLMNPIFGPRSKSVNVTDPQILDPSLVTVGRNVVIGFGTSIGAHYQDRESVFIKRIVIEDDVVVGGVAAIYGGCHIKSGAMIGGGAVLLPNTIVGANEFWGGVPAKKIADLPPLYGAPSPEQAT
jgi:hypothetical protein